MKLWIRSQDKHSLMICKRITIIDNEENCVINADNGTWDYDIGIYKTEERALEVLDEIQKMLDGRWIKEKAPSASMQYIFPIIFYEMPED